MIDTWKDIYVMLLWSW